MIPYPNALYATKAGDSPDLTSTLLSAIVHADYTIVFSGGECSY